MTIAGVATPLDQYRAQARLTWTNERWTDLFVVLVAEVPLVGEVGVM